MQLYCSAVLRFCSDVVKKNHKKQQHGSTALRQNGITAARQHGVLPHHLICYGSTALRQHSSTFFIVFLIGFPQIRTGGSLSPSSIAQSA